VDAELRQQARPAADTTAAPAVQVQLYSSLSFFLHGFAG
jgi:hypothetical protein